MTLGTKKRTWASKYRHWRPLPKTLIKRKVLGPFSEVQRCKNLFWSGKERFQWKFCDFLCSGAIRVVLGGPETLVFL